MHKAVVVLFGLAALLAGSSLVFTAGHEEDTAKPYGSSLALLDQFIKEPSIDGFKDLKLSLRRTAYVLGRKGLEKLIKSKREEGILMALIDMMDELKLMKPDVDDMARKDSVIDNVALGVDALLDARESIIDVLPPRRESSLLWDAINVFACPEIPGEIPISYDCHDEFLEFTGNREEGVADADLEPWSYDTFSNLEVCYTTAGGDHFLSPNFHLVLQALGRLSQ